MGARPRDFLSRRAAPGCPDRALLACVIPPTAAPDRPAHHAERLWDVGRRQARRGVIDRKTHAASADTKSDLFFLGVSLPLQPTLQFDAQVARLDVKDSGNDATLLVARLTRHLSKRTAVYAALGRMDNGGAAAVALDAGGTVGAGKNQNGVMAGVRHFF